MYRRKYSSVNNNNNNNNNYYYYYYYYFVAEFRGRRASEQIKVRLNKPVKKDSMENVDGKVELVSVVVWFLVRKL